MMYQQVFLFRMQAHGKRRENHGLLSPPNSLSTYSAVELWRHTKNRISLTLPLSDAKEVLSLCD